VGDGTKIFSIDAKHNLNLQENDVYNANTVKLTNATGILQEDSGGTRRTILTLRPDDVLLAGNNNAIATFFDIGGGRFVFRDSAGNENLRIEPTGELRTQQLGYGIGVANAENLSGKTGNFDGEIRMDDGTNTTNRMTPCVWDDVNSRWVNTEDGTTFT